MEPVPVDSGSVVVPDNTHVIISDSHDPDAGISPFSVINVGGGTWDYGSVVNPWLTKDCWSNYVHNGKYHSSTAIIGGAQTKRYAQAGAWSNAAKTAGAAHTCYAYWATY